MAMHEKFKFVNLPQMFRGSLPLAFDSEAKKLLADIVDRPTEMKARTLTLTFTMVPKENTNGDEASIDVKIVGKAPEKVTRIHDVNLRPDGQATFHPDLLEEPDGSTLYDPPEQK